MPLPAPCGWRGPCALSLNAAAGRLGSRGASCGEYGHRICSLEGRAADPVRVALAISRLSTLAWRRLVAWPACEILRRHLSDLCNAGHVRLHPGRPAAGDDPSAGRAAALVVGVPLTAALVLAATPLSEPPPTPPAVSPLPSPVTAPPALPCPPPRPAPSTAA